MTSVTLPWPPRILSPNGRGHYMAKHRATTKARGEAKMLAKAARLRAPAEGPIHLRITFHPPGNHGYDRDNLLASIKASLDGIADAMGVDDNRFRHGEPIVGPVVKGGSVVVEVAE